LNAVINLLSQNRQVLQVGSSPPYFLNDAEQPSKTSTHFATKHAKPPAASPLPLNLPEAVKEEHQQEMRAVWAKTMTLPLDWCKLGVNFWF
jgi:hypothetical protein